MAIASSKEAADEDDETEKRTKEIEHSRQDKERQYGANFLNVFKQVNLKPSDVLVLEYYPYHTREMSLIPNYNQWTDYAKNALSENKKLLSKFMAKNIPVFGYYYSHWLREVPKLKEYKLFYKSRARFKNHKIKELHQFLQEVL